MTTTQAKAPTATRKPELVSVMVRDPEGPCWLGDVVNASPVLNESETDDPCAAANALLSMIASHAPEGGAYNKTRVTVVFTDAAGEESAHEARFDVQRDGTDTDVREHMVGFAARVLHSERCRTAVGRESDSAAFRAHAQTILDLFEVSTEEATRIGSDK